MCHHSSGPFVAGLHFVRQWNIFGRLGHDHDIFDLSVDPLDLNLSLRNCGQDPAQQYGPAIDLPVFFKLYAWSLGLPNPGQRPIGTGGSTRTTMRAAEVCRVRIIDASSRGTHSRKYTVSKPNTARLTDPIRQYEADKHDDAFTPGARKSRIPYART